jgi:DNA-binding MarR family transcriptional regulator
MPKKTAPAREKRSAFALERFVPYLMTQIYHRLNKSFSGALRPLQLNPAQWRVLANLSGRDGQTFTELLQHTALDQPTLSRTVARLARKGFIRRKRKPVDGRAVELWLTAAGRRMFARALPVGQEQYRQTVRGVDRVERQQLTELLTRMLTNVRAMNPQGRRANGGARRRSA